jgi:ABC-type sugar transport system ATPase subunit
MAEISIEALYRRYGKVVAVDDISIVFPENTVTCLLGPSGCGKTTLMRMVAGLETPSAGRIRFGDRDVTGLPPRRRDVAMVFQYPVMYRTLTVRENLELPLRSDRQLAAEERRRRVGEVLEVLQLGTMQDRRIGELDIGTRQKVAVGRAMARHSAVTLFDEPTTNVEMNAKLQLIRAFKEMRRHIRQTVVYVTHDQTEAMTLADQIALMRDGRIVQCAEPRRLYDDPNSEFGGWFLGNPGMNFLAPRESRDGALHFDALPHPLATPSGGSDGLRIGIRPEYVRVAPAAGPETVEARVLRRSVSIGGQHLLTLAVGETRLKAKIAADLATQIGERTHIACPLERVVFFRSGDRLADRPRALG